MWINGIQVTGTYGFSYEFGPVNVLLGENGSGKSTFIKILLYALGARIHNFIDEIAKFQFCDYVHMDFTTKSGNRFLVVRKLPDMNQVTIMPYDDKGILQQEQLDILNLDEYSDFLLEEENYKKSVISYGQNKTATLTYRQLLRAGLVDQYTQHNRILADVIGENNDFLNSQVILRTAIIEKILNTLDQELQRLRLEHKQKKREYSDIRNQISFYKNIREEFCLNSDSVLKKIEKIDIEIAVIKEEKNRLFDFKYEQLKEIEKANNKVSSKAISKLRLQINKYKNELTQLEFGLEDLKKTKKSFEEELEEVKRQLVSRQILLNIPVTICPICFSELNTDEHIDLCPNCSKTKSQEKIDSVANYKHMIEESITEVEKLIDSDKNRISEIKKNLNKAQKELSEKESQYLRELGDIQEPIHNIIDQIQSRLQILIDREYKLNESKQTLIKLNRLESKKNSLYNEIKSLEEDIKLQENKSADEQLLFLKFQERYKELFICIYGEEHEISIARESYMPIIDGTNIINSNHSESIKVVAHLAYILNIFLFNQYTDKFKINSLGIVMLDSPRDKDLDIDKYEQLLDLIKNQSSGQLFLTGSLKEQTVYKKHFEEKAFLNSLTSKDKLLKKLE